VENKINLIFFGLGPMGKLVAKALVEKKGIELVGAVDIAKDIVGKDVGEVLEMGKTLGVTVTDDVEGLLSKVKADIAVIATMSRLEKVCPQLALCIKAGIDVISTCEELSYPYYKFPQLSCEIDALAKKHGVTVLGTGINPGYLMDTLPIILTGACQHVENIKVVRIMDSSRRRIPYQKKIGTGLTVAEFGKMIAEKKITGHVGLVESIAMIAAALGWNLDEIKEFPPEAIIAEEEVKTSYTVIKKGHAAGLRSNAQGIRGGKSVIALEFASYATAQEEYDAVYVEGIPKICEKISGGVHGDIGTVAVIINMIPKVLNAQPGLLTMKDLPVPSASTEDMRVYLEKRKPC
jgi:4-hydroxy-tetrahydrodipicolinate reductase